MLVLLVTGRLTANIPGNHGPDPAKHESTDVPLSILGASTDFNGMPHMLNDRHVLKCFAGSGLLGAADKLVSIDSTFPLPPLVPFLFLNLYLKNLSPCPTSKLANQEGDGRIACQYVMPIKQNTLKRSQPTASLSNYHRYLYGPHHHTIVFYPHNAPGR